jgi:dTDP-4-dehydrorhamnose reductase
MKVLIYGSTGWIGGQLVKMLKEKNITIIESKVRLENYTNISSELDNIKPTHVLLAAGLTGTPNIDWCEDNKEYVTSVNVIGTSVLGDECRKRGIHLTYLGTGCIYEYDENHTIENEIGFKEEDIPNFSKSFYSKTKIITENILKLMNNVLILRIRMPLSDDLHPRNFITKIIKYSKVINIPNSMTVLNDLLPVVIDMLINKKIGIYNFTNPGLISHNEILTLYKKYIDPEFQWQNFDLNEFSTVTKAGRSNNCLDSSKLCGEYPEIEHISKSIVKLFERMQKKLILN